MNFQNFGLIPVLTTPAGRCLTHENWVEAGVQAASFYLSSLLMKPGFDFLNTLPDLETYVGWQRTLVLNASSLSRAADGRYALRSQYDGARLYYSVLDILTLITSLKPNYVLLPEGLSEHCVSLPESIFPFISSNELETCSAIGRPFGVYILYDKTASTSSALLDQIDTYKDLHCYVAGDLSLALMLELKHRGIKFIESDIPANAAYGGEVYGRNEEISLLTNESARCFELMDQHCECPVCQQKFTQAYLHHLFEHTPLLCQRYLIQHNVHYCQTTLCKNRV